MLNESNKYHKDGTLPSLEEVFVFGSNEAGFHGAGAARAAMESFGAKWGHGVGYSIHIECDENNIPVSYKHSYAIPTKDRLIETLPIENVREYIADFVKMTREPVNVNLTWFVTRVGCGLAGFKDSEIAPLFREAVNCSFAEEWKRYLESEGN